ncbi:hypothetical protein FKW77_010799 [Venturia effusa]|uniref:Uncharacterized protein n=1 Tax=Venturia effusa TaxID=50376 RepID=A0A517KYH2_9PEZI|nr:hypothetical protein FKW77_010799 [Venturia effusa]
MKVSSVAAFFIAIAAVSGKGPYDYCCCTRTKPEQCDPDSTNAVVAKVKDLGLQWEVSQIVWAMYDGAPWKQTEYVWIREKNTKWPPTSKERKNDGKIGVKEFSEYCDKFGKLGNNCKCWNKIPDPDSPPCPPGKARSRSMDDRTCRTEYFTDPHYRVPPRE